MTHDSTVNRLTRFCIADPEVFSYLWVVANGEPTAPSGEVFSYGDDDFQETLIAMFSNDLHGLPLALRAALGHSPRLIQASHGIDVDDVVNLTEAEVAELRSCVISHGPARQVRCLNCGEKVEALEVAMQEHYMDVKCWEDRHDS